jgi:hypothetical protein
VFCTRHGFAKGAALAANPRPAAIEGTDPGARQRAGVERQVRERKHLNSVVEFPGAGGW